MGRPWRNVGFEGLSWWGCLLLIAVPFLVSVLLLALARVIRFLGGLP